MAISLRFIVECVESGRIYWTGHVAQRMVERRITITGVKQALLCGEIIEQHPDDKPYPSCLVLGWLESGDPLHIKCSCKPGTQKLRIVTVYEPDEAHWEKDYKTRKRR